MLKVPKLNEKHWKLLKTTVKSPDVVHFLLRFLGKLYWLEVSEWMHRLLQKFQTSLIFVTTKRQTPDRVEKKHVGRRGRWEGTIDTDQIGRLEVLKFSRNCRIGLSWKKVDSAVEEGSRVSHTSLKAFLKDGNL